MGTCLGSHSHLYLFNIDMMRNRRALTQRKHELMHRSHCQHVTLSLDVRCSFGNKPRRSSGIDRGGISVVVMDDKASKQTTSWDGISPGFSLGRLQTRRYFSVGGLINFETKAVANVLRNAAPYRHSTNRTRLWRRLSDRLTHRFHNHPRRRMSPRCTATSPGRVH